jgi:hypothetical protein
MARFCWSSVVMLMLRGSDSERKVDVPLVSSLSFSFSFSVPSVGEYRVTIH